MDQYVKPKKKNTRIELCFANEFKIFLFVK